MFVGFIEGESYVKMKKPRKKKIISFQLGRALLFMKYPDGKGFLEQNERGRICVIKTKG